MESVLLACFWLSFGVLTNNFGWLIVGFLLSAFLAILFTLKVKHVSISGYLLYWLGFNLILLASAFIHGNDIAGLRLPLLSLSGCLWMFVGEHLKHIPNGFKIVKQSIMYASLGFVILWIVSWLFHWDLKVFGPDSLVTYASYYKNHNHLGDFLILPLIIIILAPNPLGAVIFIVIMMATSRSSLIGLLVGVGYALYNRKLSINFKKMVPLSILFIIIFVIMSYGKSTIRSRDYYVQTVAAIIQHPLGVGYGNFDVISINPRYHVLGATGFSTYAHSIIFEWLGGIGWVGLLGVGWLILIAYRMGTKTADKHKRLLRSLWWAMLVPMMLDSVYVVPSYWWLWMLITGMSW